MDDVFDVVRNGRPISKDLPNNKYGRQPGINFRGTISDGGEALVKVSWRGYFFIPTVIRI